MSTRTESLEIQIENDSLKANFLSPPAKVPGILFVHGWGGSQQRDLARAKNIAGLGCICLTFDLRGHDESTFPRTEVTRAHSLADICAAYDRLAAHDAIDKNAIAVIGTSYGGYLATFLSTLRPVRWLALRAPALYWDDEWTLPKQQLDRERLRHYRHSKIGPADNKALEACARFTGDVLLVESEHDDYVPHQTIMNYRAAFQNTHSLTHRLLSGADHGLVNDVCQKAYTAILTAWISEMVIGNRTGEYPHYAPPL